MPLMMLVLMAGFWRRGKRSGFGKHFYSHGDIYEGQFLNDLENGKGKFLSSMGVLYRGEFENGLMHGSGILKEEDGSVYEGEFQQGEKHGVGLMIYSDGSRYHGEWREGKAFGFGRSTINCVEPTNLIVCFRRQVQWRRPGGATKASGETTRDTELGKLSLKMETVTKENM
jgi:hypothetical protein